MITYNAYKPITSNEILDIAKTNFKDPMLENLRKRILIVYTSYLTMKYVLKGGKQTIINDCLIIDRPRSKRIIPLHPIVLEIFRSIDYQKISIPCQGVHELTKQIVSTAGITESYQLRIDSEFSTIYRYYFLYPQQLSLPAANHQQECEFSDEHINLLSGYHLQSPEERNKYNSVLNELFKNPFYDCLKYVASDHLK